MDGDTVTPISLPPPMRVGYVSTRLKFFFLKKNYGESKLILNLMQIQTLLEIDNLHL
ncbi:hypothetical protein D3C87_105670 [compost metagenome]